MTATLGSFHNYCLLYNFSAKLSIITARQKASLCALCLLQRRSRRTDRLYLSLRVHLPTAAAPLLCCYPAAGPTKASFVLNNKSFKTAQKAHRPIPGRVRLRAWRTKAVRRVISFSFWHIFPLWQALREYAAATYSPQAHACTARAATATAV
ncbi:hypothetical protein DSECCO2_565960 [anaerobic digester metagenome]